MPVHGPIRRAFLPYAVPAANVHRQSNGSFADRLHAISGRKILGPNCGRRGRDQSTRQAGRVGRRATAAASSSKWLMTASGRVPSPEPGCSRNRPPPRECWPPWRCRYRSSNVDHQRRLDRSAGAADGLRQRDGIGLAGEEVSAPQMAAKRGDSSSRSSRLRGEMLELVGADGEQPAIGGEAIERRQEAGIGGCGHGDVDRCSGRCSRPEQAIDVGRLALRTPCAERPRPRSARGAPWPTIDGVIEGGPPRQSS